MSDCWTSYRRRTASEIKGRAGEFMEWLLARPEKDVPVLTSQPEQDLLWFLNYAVVLPWFWEPQHVLIDREMNTYTCTLRVSVNFNFWATTELHGIPMKTSWNQTHQGFSRSSSKVIRNAYCSMDFYTGIQTLFELLSWDVLNSRCIEREMFKFDISRLWEVQCRYLWEVQYSYASSAFGEVVVASHSTFLLTLFNTHLTWDDEYLGTWSPYLIYAQLSGENWILSPLSKSFTNRCSWCVKKIKWKKSRNLG